MHPSRYSLLAAAFLGLAPAASVPAQETAPASPLEPAEATAPASPEAAVPAGTSPAAEAPTLEPAPEAGAAPDAAVPAGTSPAGTAPTLEAAPEVTPDATPQTAAPGEGAPGTEAPSAPPQPEITVTKQGDWEIGCVAGTSNCEMQQVALDAAGNPVVLVRVVKLPEAQEAEALAIFNTPLGTLLPTGLGFQIDAGEAGTLPFEWCVQEGCIVRLGLRGEEVAAMKRGSAVKLRVASIADPDQPVDLTLSLTGFTAGYDSLGIPEAPAGQAEPAPATQN